MNKLFLILLMVAATSAAHAQKELIPEETNYIVLTKLDGGISNSYLLDFGGPSDKLVTLKDENSKKIRRLARALNYLNEWEVIQVNPTEIFDQAATEYILKRKN